MYFVNNMIVFESLVCKNDIVDAVLKAGISFIKVTKDAFLLGSKVMNRLDESIGHNKLKFF